LSFPVDFRTLLEVQEPKMQSTGQGGPEVNRDLEVLFETLIKMLRGVQGMTTALQILTSGSSGGTTGGSPPPPTTGGSTPSSFVLTHEDAVILAGTGETEDTEDAWTTVDAGAPADAVYVLLQVLLDGDADTHGGEFWVRQANTEPETLMARIVFTSDSGDVNYAPIVIQKINGDGNIDYLADTTTSQFTWKLQRVGYIVC
jgi:hypothetical protein